jgi:hypothetical protein
MHRCPTCPGRLVYPLSWKQLDHHQWWMQLRCPDCDHVREVILTRSAVEAYEHTTETAYQSLSRSAERWAQGGMQTWCELFCAALNADAIVAFDFH